MSEYFETSDGEQFFKEDPAKLHARSLKDQKVKTVSRPDETEVSKTETAKDIVVKSVEMDLETAREYLATEEALEAPRKTVVEALQKRIAEIENIA
ncbi:MAG: hypothetical protein RSA74_14700 [Chryseobacterium sp.]